MSTLYTRMLAQPNRLLYYRAGIFTLLGLTFIRLDDSNLLVSTGLFSVLMLLLGLTAIRFWMVFRAFERTALWFSLIGLLDILFSFLLILYSNHPKQAISLTFSAWGLVMGFIQAIESIYVFLAVKVAGPTSSGSLPTIFLHGLNVLLGVGMAYILVFQPYGQMTFRIAGLFPLGFGILLILLIRRVYRIRQLP